MASFTITGEFLTETARNLMLEDEPGKAYRLIADCLIGTGAENVARQLLTGEINLIGDTKVGIDVEDADGQPETVAYIEKVRRLYAGRVRLQGRWYRPRGVVLTYGPEDARWAIKRFRNVENNLLKLGRARAEFYADEGERVEFVHKCGDVTLGWRTTSTVAVVFSPCSEPPHWIKPAADAQAAVLEVLATRRTLEILGADPERTGVRPSAVAEQIIRTEKVDDDLADALREMAYAEEDAQRAAEVERIATAVREQAGDDVFSLTLLDGRVVQVPRVPFMHWALSRVPEFSKSSLPAWELVSPSGLKMVNDDRYHTDWMLGAGLPLDESYTDNVNRAAWDAAMEMQIAEVDRG